MAKDDISRARSGRVLNTAAFAAALEDNAVFYSLGDIPGTVGSCTFVSRPVWKSRLMH